MKTNGGALEHAWSYFQLHATQRITVFNYFVVFSGVLATGLATAVQANPRLAAVGIVLGLLLSLLSFLFWKLDQRASFLIKHAEELIKTLEPTTAPLFKEEVAKTEHARKTKGLWTICIHPCTASTAEVNRLRWFLKDHWRQFTSFDRIVGEFDCAALGFRERVYERLALWRVQRRQRTREKTVR